MSTVLDGYISAMEVLYLGTQQRAQIALPSLCLLQTDQILLYLGPCFRE